MKWSEFLSKDILDFGYSLYDRAAKERKEGKIIYPPQDQIFRALKLTPPQNVKVCIVGQDPYHTPDQANGLAFSVNSKTTIQPSLKNIFKELKEDTGIDPELYGDLTNWAKNGALLLNTTLTVYKGQPNSNANWGWIKFTREVLKAVNQLPQPVVFVLWGSNAQSLLPSLTKESPKDTIVDRENKKAYILSSHPSPLSASKKCGNTQPFKGSHPFKTINDLLVELGGEPMDWSIRNN